MFTPTVRLLAITSAVALGVLLLLQGSLVGLAWFFPAGLFAWGYWRYSTVWLAWRACRGGDLERAAALLARVPSYRLLTPQLRAYHDWMKGVVAHDRGDDITACDFLERAIAGGLRTTNDRCIAICELASITIVRGQFENALAMLEQAEQLPHRESAEGLIRQLREKATESGESPS